MMFLQIEFEVALEKVTSHSYAMVLKPCCAVCHSSFYNDTYRSFKDIPYTYLLKDFNNYNTFFCTNSRLHSILR